MPVQFDQSKLGTVTFTQVTGGASALTYVLPTAQGANGEYLRGDGAGNLIWLANNGLGTAMGTSLLTTGAGATTNISIINPGSTAIGGTANMTVAFLPQGYPTVSIWQSQVTDSTATGGNIRGSGGTGPAYDFQKVRSAATQVASGGSSVILGGANNTNAGGTTAICGGFNNSISPSTAIVCSIIGGSGNTITGGSTNSAYNLIMGGSGNSISFTGGATSVTAAAILGGLNNTTTGDYTTILGGYGQQGRGYIGAWIWPTANPLGLSSSNSLCQFVTMNVGTQSSTSVGAREMNSNNLTGTTTAFNTLANSNNCATFIWGYAMVAQLNSTGKVWSFDFLTRKATTAASMTLVGGSTPTVIVGTNTTALSVNRVASTTTGSATVNMQLNSSVSNWGQAFLFSCEVSY